MDKKFLKIGATIISTFIALFASDPFIELIYQKIEESLVQASGGLEFTLKCLKAFIGFLRVDLVSILIILITGTLIIFRILLKEKSD